MSVLTLYVDEVMRTLSNDGQYPFVVNDKTVDIVRFALNTGFTDVVLDEQTALRVMYQRPGETEVCAQTLTYYDTDGLRNYYDWQLLSADLTKKGTLTVALCILRTDSEVEEWHTTPYQIRVLDTIHTDDSDEADETITPTVAQRVAVLETMIQRVASGAPIVVSSTSAMTDTNQIYVLSTDGNWYYHNGTTWTAGGTYGAVATDTTLTQSGIPADAKAVGDEIADLKEDLEHKEIYNHADLSTVTWERALIDSTGKITTPYVRAILSSMITLPEGCKLIRYTGATTAKGGTLQYVFLALYNGEAFQRRAVALSNGNYSDVIPESNTTSYRICCSVASSAIETIPLSHSSDIYIEYQNVLDDLQEVQNNIRADVNVLNKAVLTLAEYNGADMSWSQGGISDRGGATVSSYFIRTGFMPRPKSNILHYTGAETDADGVKYSVQLVQYDESWGFIERNTNLNHGDDAILRDNCAYIRWAFGHASSTGVTVTTDDRIYFKAEYQITNIDILFKDVEEFADQTKAIKHKVNKPESNQDGTNGQVLATYGDGRTYWTNPEIPPTSVLTDIIEQWLKDNPQAIGNEANRAYPTVNDMKADRTISDGMICRTMGYYSAGDGGAGYYSITSIGADNGMDIITIDNGKIASLIKGKTLNVKQFGAYGDGIHDDSSVLIRVVSLLDDNMTLLFPAGVYIHGDGEQGENGTGNSYTPTGDGNTYYHDAEHSVNIGRDIRLIISDKSNIVICGESGAEIRSNNNNGECRNNEIFDIMHCSDLVIKDITINGNRENRGLHLTDSDYGGYNLRGNLRLSGCKRVLIDNVKSINSGMDGLYVGVYNDGTNKIKSRDVYLTRCDFSNAHRNNISIGGCDNVYIDKCIANKAGTSGETWAGTNPKAAVDIEADYGANYPNNNVFISDMQALESIGYSIWIAAHANNVYVDRTLITESTYTSPNDISNINLSTITLT